MEKFHDVSPCMVVVELSFRDNFFKMLAFILLYGSYQYLEIDISGFMVS